MVEFLRIKEKARGLARQQKYDLALAEYRAAIAQAEADGDLPALRNLYNAAGDAALQKPDSAAAIDWFEKAADSYLDEGLFDNAIALCHKILRHVPTKADVYAKLGRIYGAKGLHAESARNWLEYADRREKAGDERGVILALREVVAAAPDDDASRERLAAHLERAGDAAAALAEVEELGRRASAAGDANRAADLATRASGLRGAAGAGAPAAAGAAPAASGPEPAPPPHAVAGEAYVPVGPAPSSTRPALEPAGAPAGEEGGGAATFGFGTEGPALAPPEPSDRGAGPGEEPPEPPRIASVPVEERLARAEARLAENPDDAEERIYLGELYLETGDHDRAVAAMSRGARELVSAGEPEKAWRAWRQVVGLSPGDPDPAERMLEAAEAAGSRELVLESRQVLAERLVEAGRYDRAAEMYGRILEGHPDHGPARDGLLLLEGLAAGGAPAPKAAPHVPAPAVHAPEPGVHAPGATALELGDGDFQSHYDLGVAFREMGLLDEAVREFQLAARGDVLRGRAFEMIGRCHLERGHASLAVSCFRRGLEAESDPEHARSLRYHLGRALEDAGEAPAAREEYERVVAEDASFLDAAERLRSLA